MKEKIKSSETTYESNGEFKIGSPVPSLSFVESSKTTSVSLFNTKSSETEYSQDMHSLRLSDFGSHTSANSPVQSTDNSAFTWAFFNSPATMTIAGLLLLAGGLFTLTMGAIVSSASMITAGAVIASVGALLGMFGQFINKPALVNQSKMSDEVLDSTLNLV